MMTHGLHTFVSLGRKRHLAKVSNIVITYNNLENTRFTSKSVLAKTKYPHYEVVVVDSGSGQEMRDWLWAFTRDHTGRVWVVSNECNPGFTAGNNRGIRATVTIKYVVLLNSDYIATPGWLTQLIDHPCNPQIGMSGPVTNFAGNEAKIDGGYTYAAGTDDLARCFMGLHCHYVFDIETLAMFCIVMYKPTVNKMGFLDDHFVVEVLEDDDYSVRVREAGLRAVCAEVAYVHHFGRAAFSKLDEERYARLFADNKRQFEEKWGKQWVAHQYRPWITMGTPHRVSPARSSQTAYQMAGGAPTSRPLSGGANGAG